MMPKARMEDGDGGKTPAGEGWFIVNARDAAWFHNDRFGAGVTFEGASHFQHYGINVQVLWPGQPNGYYHAEDGQEDFLILSGEGVLLVEGQERPVKAWDFVHFPPETEHILVGSGDGPCVFLAVGARNAGEGIRYPVSDVALRHEAGVSQPANSGDEAYVGAPETTRGPAPDGLFTDR
jgi:uncharacterized cupin superfamily protein